MIFAASLLKGVLGFARRVPPIVWVVLALLAFGGWQKHRAESAAKELATASAKAAAARETKLQEDAAETARRLAESERAADEARKKTEALAADAARAVSAERRVLGQLAALKANRRPADPAAPSSGPPADEAVGLLADMLGRCGRRVRELALYADSARVAGEACVAAYEGLDLKK